MRRVAPVLAGALLLTLLSFMAAARDAGRGPRPPFYPAAINGLAFSHRAHLARDMACGRCHEDALKSRQAEDLLLPGEQVCAPCHQSEVRVRPAEGLKDRCLRCHPGLTPGQDLAPKKRVYPAAPLVFGHLPHLRQGMACETCHAGMDQVERSGAGVLPGEESCLSCHHKDQTSRGCLFCHPGDNQGRIKEPRKPAQGPLDHGDRWLLRHGVQSRGNGRTCESCHGKAYCFQCHGGVIKPQTVHPADYKLVHPVEARQNPGKCRQCHVESRDCRACHQRLSLSPRENPSATRRAVHPDGWGTCSLNVNHHAYQARRSLQTCASCHTESACIACHKPGGQCGGLLSVHRHLGPGVLSDMKKRNPEVCRKCHGNSVP